MIHRRYFYRTSLFTHVPPVNYALQFFTYVSYMLLSAIVTICIWTHARLLYSRMSAF